MSASLSEITAYLDDYLEVGAVADYGPNGLQIEGRSQVGRLATGVSACQELFARAREWGADSVLVHHGLFWEGMPYSLTGVQFRRVAELVTADISLLAYHLPLDRHSEVGNNAVAARALGLEEISPFGHHRGVTIGFQGSFAEPVAFDELLRRCEALYQQRPLGFAADQGPVTTVGIISGGAQKELHQAIAARLDAFITGEAGEFVMNLARESGTRYIAAGHYATERLGVQALGDHLAGRFGIEAEFFDVPNPV